MLMFGAIWKFMIWFGPTGPNGTTANPIMAATIAITGAIRYSGRDT